MLAGFKTLTLKLNKAYKKGQWNRFIISFLILAQLGLLAIADGWASPPEKINVAGKGGAVAETNGDTGRNTACEMTWDKVQETDRDTAAEAAIFQELIQISETTLDRVVIYAWVQVPRPAGQNGSAEDPQYRAARCREKIMERIPGQNKTEYSAGSYLIETNLGELIKVSTRNSETVSPHYPKAASDYLLVEVSQIASVERAVLLRQLVTQALAETEADALHLDRTEPNDIVAVPVKSSLNLTLSRSGHLTQAEQLKLVKQMLGAAGAGNSQGLNSSELISLTAYTSRLAGYETLAGEPVNLQLASRYHSLDNRTYFQIGAPLLMIEY